MMPTKSIDEILKQAVNACAEDLSKEHSTRRRFCFPIDKEAASCLLTEAYRVEVERGPYAFTLTPDIQAQISAIAEWLTDPGRKSSLLLYGRIGTAKSTLARAIKRMAERLRDSFGPAGRARLQREAQAFFPADIVLEFERKENAVVVPTYAHALTVAEMAKDHRDRFNQICEVSFLILDEIGAESREVNSYGTIYIPIAELLQRRYDRFLPVIITTNLGDAEIERLYGPRIIDRINEMCEKIPFNGKSFRV